MSFASLALSPPKHNSNKPWHYFTVPLAILLVQITGYSVYLVFTVCGVGVVHSRFGGLIIRLSATIIFLEVVLFYNSYCQPIACFGAV